MTDKLRLRLTFGTKTPPQWERFTKEYATQYDQAFPNKRMVLTDARWSLMCAIQREVNTRTRYKPDPGGSDHWEVLLNMYPDALVGDCEDYALTKRLLLIEAGFPMGSVWPVICKRPTHRASTSLIHGVPHMVTVVSTKHADYVLDQAQPDWIHDVTESKLIWLSAYDGKWWRHATTTSVPD